MRRDTRCERQEAKPVKGERREAITLRKQIHNTTSDHGVSQSAQEGPLYPRRRVHGERPVRVRRLRHGRGDLETTSRPHPPIRRAAHVHIQSAARMPSRESADCPAMAAPVGVPTASAMPAPARECAEACLLAQTLLEPATPRARAGCDAKKPATRCPACTRGSQAPPALSPHSCSL